MQDTPVDPKAVRRELRILAFSIIAFFAFVYGVRVLIITLHEAALTPVATVTDPLVETGDTVDGKQARELTGSVVSVAEDTSSVRLLVPGEGIYAIRIDEYPLFADEVVADPSAQFTVMVTEEPETAPHDYALKSYRQVAATDTIEERIKELEAIAGSLAE